MQSLRHLNAPVCNVVTIVDKHLVHSPQGNTAVHFFLQTFTTKLHKKIVGWGARSIGRRRYWSIIYFQNSGNTPEKKFKNSDFKNIPAIAEIITNQYSNASELKFAHLKKYCKKYAKIYLNLDTKPTASKLSK